MNQILFGKRKKTRVVNIGNVSIGGNHPIAVQSMTKTYTSDINSTIKQIKQLEEVGCKIVRVAVPDRSSAEAIKKIKKSVKIPIVADIHFDYTLAIEAIKNGADKIRINPANIPSKDHLLEIIKEAKLAKIPIRLGFNAGSFKNTNYKKVQNQNYYIENILTIAKKYISFFEHSGFTDIVISLKTSDVISTIKCYEWISQNYDYPLHIGITEAGPLLTGSIKSSLGIGILLFHGIGDTIRVSLTGNPVDEVKVGYYILQSLGLISYGIDLISCPTCGRCKSDLFAVVNKFEQEVQKISFITKFPSTIKVAIMGCEVNGPGEAKHADIGIAMGKNYGVLFVKGKIIKKVSIKDCIKELITQIKQFYSSY